jgi:hypothetical protein
VICVKYGVKLHIVTTKRSRAMAALGDIPTTGSSLSQQVGGKTERPLVLSLETGRPFDLNIASDGSGLDESTGITGNAEASEAASLSRFLAMHIDSHEAFPEGPEAGILSAILRDIGAFLTGFRSISDHIRHSRKEAR